MINLDEILSRIEAIKESENIRLIAVSKNVTSAEVRALYTQGQLEFGENRVNELAKKQGELAKFKDIKWHMIGRLQSNKINQLIALAPALWQSCDSLKRAIEVNKRLNFRLPALLQINSSNEASKQGVSTFEATEIYHQILEQCPNLELLGVMSIGAHSDDRREIIKSFEATFKIYDDLKAAGAKICSMGMSADFEIAIKCGSNMIRLGSILYK